MSKHLEIARRATYNLSPDLQPFAQLPTGAVVPLYSEDFFTWFLEQTDKDQIPNPTSAEFNYLLRQIDAETWSRQNIRPVSLRTAKFDHFRHHINLGDQRREAIEISAKGWCLIPGSTELFLTPTLSLPLPQPPENEPPENLPETLAKMFGLEEKPALQLAHWLAQAMLGGPPPPILVITGSARAQAAAQLRNLLDPVAQPVHPLPYSTRALGQLALSNKVLAFSIGGRLTKAKQSAFNDLQDGMLVKLKEANKRRQAISTTLARAIILSAATKIEVHPHQFTIEVNQASESTQSGELFSALLSAMVKFLRLLRDHAEHHGLQLALPPPTAFHPVEFSDAPAP